MAYPRFLCAALCATCLTFPLNAGESCIEDAIIVFDGSGSMSEMGFNDLDEPRIFEARRALRRAIPDIAPFRRLGLVIYGPGPEEACHNIDLRFAPQANAAPRLLAEVEALRPSGDTPLTAAVGRAAAALGAPSEPGTVVLVTDGKETCGGAPCQLAAELAADAPGLTVHVIGFKVRGEYFSWGSQGGSDYTETTTIAQCLADQTGGKYVSTETVDELVAALQDTLGCKLIGGLRVGPLPRG
ncbi:vWA domain-containing protein [Tropicimonas sp. S265A]|uniref:vWA domain-containing protein n=1 Tax=Tropicimonas sp. S265A TaxID=3415134 RepID=UPI003C7C15A7